MLLFVPADPVCIVGRYADRWKIRIPGFQHRNADLCSLKDGKVRLDIFSAPEIEPDQSDRIRLLSYFSCHSLQHSPLPARSRKIGADRSVARVGQGCTAVHVDHSGFFDGRRDNAVMKLHGKIPDPAVQKNAFHFRDLDIDTSYEIDDADQSIHIHQSIIPDIQVEILVDDLHRIFRTAANQGGVDLFQSIPVKIDPDISHNAGEFDLPCFSVDRHNDDGIRAVIFPLIQKIAAKKEDLCLSALRAGHPVPFMIHGILRSSLPARQYGSRLVYALPVWYIMHVCVCHYIKPASEIKVMRDGDSQSCRNGYTK